MIGRKITLENNTEKWLQHLVGGNLVKKYDQIYKYSYEYKISF